MSGINSSNNICVALNNLYGNLLDFIDKYEFNEEQKKYFNDIRLNLLKALPLGKFVTSKLECFKIKEDPNYNQKKFFEEDKDYIEDMAVEAENLKKHYKKYEIKHIDEKSFFEEKSISGFKKYQLLENYSNVYNIALLLNDMFDDEQQKKFEQVIKRILHCYYMAFRMCKKLHFYREKYPFDGDDGKYWLKDQKMGKIKDHAMRFKKINEERFERKKK